MSYLKLIVGVLVLVAIAGAYWYPKAQDAQQPTVGAAVGTTFNTAKIAAVNMSPTTAAATTTYITNNDDSDRIITDGFYACNGIGTSLSAYTGSGLVSLGVLLIAATNTPANAAAGVQASAANAAFNTTFATTSPQINLASSSTNGAASWMYRWNAGSSLIFSFNATNTANCTIGVKYLAT